MQRKFQVMSVSDGNYCFIVDSLIVEFYCSYTCSRSSDSELCLLSIFTHSCVYLAFRYSLIKFAWDGSNHFMMSMHTFFCDSLNKSLGWIILLISRTVVWSFGCRLNSFGHVSRCGVLKLFIYTIVIIWLVCPRMLEFIEETLPKFTRIFILVI